MRVALDASFLALPPSGTGTYVRELTAALRRVAPDLDLVALRPDGEDGGASRAHLGRLARARWELVGVARAARRVRPDLLHVPHFSAPLVPGPPLVVTVHDVIPLVLPAYRDSRYQRARLAAVSRTVRRARLVLTPSRAAADDVARVLGVPPGRVRVTPEATGPEFAPAADPAVAGAVAARLGVTGRYVFNVGGLDVRKNLPVLLEAFARALPRLAEPAQLVIAGAAHSGRAVVFPPLEPHVERLGLGGKVVLAGFVSDADKLALYQGAALYATPSAYEGFGLTALEAMACGVPVLAADRTSLPEVVGDGGLLLPPEAEAFAAAMVEVLNDAALAADLSRRGVARAGEFSWERTARLTLEAYREALTEKPPTS